LDAILFAVFIVIGFVTPVFRKMGGSIGRLIPFFGLLFQLIGIAILYKENLGVNFSSLGVSYTLPMTASGVGLPNFPEASLFFILTFLIDAIATVAP
jgi:hypothetical protein